jgi:phosphoribosylaminoimidazolecarboxamide formyltransferase/IMP cyclohydrolase
MIRAAAKNHQDVLVVAQRNDYEALGNLLEAQKSMTTLAQRRAFAAKAFEVVAHYDVAIAEYFRNEATDEFFLSVGQKQSLRYGENPHQPAVFYGAIDSLFDKLNGKELSYNNLVDVDAALQIMGEFQQPAFAIIKHTNVCGVALADTIENAWTAALSGDPESAFGGVLVTNRTITPAVASQINELFFEVLIAPTYEAEALATLKTKKNRILLQQKNNLAIEQEYKRILNGVLVQDADAKAYDKWEERGARETTEKEKQDLAFANIVCKHLKSNAIALIKDKKLIGKGCGQTSRIDALRQAIEKSKQFGFSLEGAVLASDAFFPFDDCARMAHEAGITAIIQPGGSVRDQDTINYCKDHGLALVMTGMRHFKH